MKSPSTLHASRLTPKDALLEIGSEELPASFISIGMQQLQTLAQASLTEHKIAFKGIQVYGTPRRLSILIEELAARSEDQQKKVTGPPEAIAKDAHGGWTPAALGFARKQNLKPSDLRIENGKTAADLHIKGTPARQLLAELFPLWIKKLEFPKSMTWEPTHFRYPRPLRWILALYGADPVSFGLAGIRSSRFTYGLYLQSSKQIKVSSASKYTMLLKDHCVLVDPEARVDAIRKMSEQAIRRVHGRVIMHDTLLKQVANLVEHPAAIVGNFDPAFLELPAEVLVTCLEHHQKYFPVQAEKGHKLLPHFVGIRNGMSVHQEVVREGYERVLTARLADARFFYQNDRKAPLASRINLLKGVIFQQKLGSLFDKKERVKQLIEKLAEPLGLSAEDRAKALRVADLGKADLVTNVVREFPELQGIMARIYAQVDGEDPVVAQALEQHYWPVTLSGQLPESPIGALVSLADKLDTLAGDFAVGLIPTGSADPYGLRRAAVGVLRILEARGWRLELGPVLREAVALQPVKERQDETEKTLIEFMKQRIQGWLSERGIPTTVIEAALGSHWEVIPTLLSRLPALQQVPPAFSEVAKRVNNIIRQVKQKKEIYETLTGVQVNLLSDPSELSLFSIFSERKPVITEALAREDYAGALRALAELRDPLDVFFKGVMVMVEDVPLRNNRLSLLQDVHALCAQIADFSKLQNA